MITILTAILIFIVNIVISVIGI